MSGRLHLSVTALLPASLLVLIAAITSGTGAYGLFTSSSATKTTIAEAGSLELEWGDPSLSNTALAIKVGPLFPAIAVQRIADLRNSGSVGIQNLQLTITGTDTGTTSDGLQLAIDRCREAWIEEGSHFICPGTILSVSADRPLKAVISLTDSSAKNISGVDHLRFTFRVPDTSPNVAQGTTYSVHFVATGTS